MVRHADKPGLAQVNDPGGGNDIEEIGKTVAHRSLWDRH